ncbi:unnamed protein product [Paramecium sonneborni]|uniref:Uncharacterized protein n=1 Tax=Paramecium sonneborni TaxID=65129 RepID=A0A8S1R328_9CILI|nr:unnamed protein product [Paramecium sonneborni]
MGLTCGALCSRERDKTTKSEADLAEFAFYQHLEETRSQGSYRRTACMMPISEFAGLMNSASNYWINKQQYQVCGNNRPMFTYNLQNRNLLLKIDNSVFTLQEKQCAIRIQRWWRKKQEKARKSKKHSKSYVNLFYR